MEEKEVDQLLELISQLNHKQWQMLKVSVDIAFNAKIKDTKVIFNRDVKKLIHEDLDENG